MKSKVTVLTTVYNGLPYLKDAIESTLNQTYKDFEYLIIDDASPDPEVLDLIESYNDPRIKLIKNKLNLGVSETINKALSLIETPFVVRLDQDDISLPNRIHNQITYLENNPEVSIVCSWEHQIDSEGKMIRDWKTSIDNYGEFLGPVLLGICPIWHPSIAFKRESVINSGGFKKEYVRAEDFEMTARLAIKRYEASIVPEFDLLQRQHQASQSQEFEQEQKLVTNQIQLEAISNFIDNHSARKISYLLRLEEDPKLPFTKETLLELKEILNELFKNILTQQKLSELEFISLKKIIFKRVGYGVRIMHYYSFLPERIFMVAFYILSPLFLTRFHKMLSKLYNNMLSIKYKVK